MKLKTIRQLKKLSGKTILLRSDFNVPVKDGEIAEDFRLKQSLKTIDYLSSRKAKLVICSHLGRPKGKRETKFSLAPIAHYLEKKLHQNVKFIEDKIGSESFNKKIENLQEGEIAVIENLRFYPGEKENDSDLAKKMAAPMDVYVNDAFGVSHRKHASVDQIKKFLSSYAGFLLEKEVNKLEVVLKPEKPLILILGGSKIETKAPLIENFISKSQFILIGGALANNFLKAFKFEVGKSLLDQESLKEIRKLSKDAKFKKKLILPQDCLVETGQKKVKVKPVKKIAKTDKIKDIGPQTIYEFSQKIKQAKTLIWNGPMGEIEDSRFSQGTKSIAKSVGLQSSQESYSVVGGGETVQSVVQSKVDTDMNLVSTGGGATLAYLAGKSMPGLNKLWS